jgi:hypothetical protein
MKRFTVLAFVSLIPLSYVHAQKSDSDLREALLNSSHEQRAEALEQLGLRKEDARKYEDEGPSMAGGITWTDLKPDRNVSRALVFLPCPDGSDGATLLLLQKSQSSWVTSDTTVFDCHYNGAVSIQVASLRNAHEQDVLVQHATDEHGTAWLQQDAYVYAIEGGKLEEVFRVKDRNRNMDTDEESVFLPVQLSNSTVSCLEETRFDRGKSGLVQRRMFCWSASHHKFVTTGFKSVTTEAIK